jgi:hypothetical protein
MKTTKIDIEDLLKNLPTEKTAKDFTAQLMTRISNLPAPPSKQPDKLVILSICIGILGLIIGAWWISDYFFGWTQVYVQPVFKGIAGAFSNIFSTISQIKLSAVVIEGLLAGAILLLIDAAIQRRRVAPRQ